MPISEDALQIRAVANDSSASGAAQLASSNLGDALLPTIDPDTVGVLQEAISGLENGINVAAGAAGGDDEQTIRGAGSVAMEAFMTALQFTEQARAAVETASQAVQQAKDAADNAIAAGEQFRQTCDAVATKHGA